MHIIGNTYRYLLLLICLTAVMHGAALAQTNAFNFQGRLNDGGNAANGNYDLRFKLFDSFTGGNQVGFVFFHGNIAVINGVFSTQLNFGDGAFSGSARFLEIAVKPANSTNEFVILGARQQILPVPFSINANELGGIPAPNYARLNAPNSGSFTAGNIVSVGSFSVTGNTLQPAEANGLPKALMNINFAGFVTSCYNGINGNNTKETCGFDVTLPIGPVGVTRIDFGFPILNRYIVATPRSVSTNPKFVGVPFIVNVNQTTVDVFMLRLDSPKDTAPIQFSLMVF